MHAQRHAIVALARRGMIVNGIFFAIMRERVGKQIKPQRGEVLVKHIGECDCQCVTMVGDPFVKYRSGVDVLGHTLLTEAQHGLLAPQPAGPAQLLLDASQVLAHGVEVFQKTALLAQAAA